MDILWTKSWFHICFHVQTLSYWTKSGHILDFHVQCMSKSFMIGQGFDRHWTGLDSDWTDLVNFPAFGQTLDRGWTWFGFCVQALSNQPSLRSTEYPWENPVLDWRYPFVNDPFQLFLNINNLWSMLYLAVWVIRGTPVGFRKAQEFRNGALKSRITWSCVESFWTATISISMINITLDWKRESLENF